MDEQFLIAVLGLLVLAILLAPVFAIVAWTRVRKLEARFEHELARLRSAPAAEPPPTELVPVETLPSSVAAPLPETSQPTAPPALELPPTPSRESGFDLESLIAGRWLNRLGLLAVAIGVSYFLKYAIDNDWIGPRGQVALGILLGTSLIATAPLLTKRGLVYFADGLTGLGAAILYLSLWAAGSYYRFISTSATFVVMAAVTALLLVLALGRRSQAIAIIGMLGGFLTPWLVSTGQDAQIVLFTYVALLNAGLLWLVRRQEWRFIEVPAFVFTQIYFWGWFDRFYTDDKLARTAAFATLFFAQFQILPVLRSQHTSRLRPEHGLLLVSAVVAFMTALHAMLWPTHRWLLSGATLALAGMQVAAARLVPVPGGQLPLARVLLAGLALTLVTLVIPIRLSEHWISIAWAVEAAVLMWSGFSVRLVHLRVAAFVLFGIVAVRLLADPLPAAQFLFNVRFFTFLIVAACAGASLWFARQQRDSVGRHERVPFAVLGVAMNILLITAVTMEVDLFFQGDQYGVFDTHRLLARSLAVSLIWTLSASLLVLAGVRLASAAVRWQGLVLFGVTSVKVFLNDLAFLSGFYRIMSSIALGVVLLIVSLIYQRRMAAVKAADQT